MDDEKWMRLALEEALHALEHNDVPIGAIAVRDGEVIGRGHNCRERDQDPTAHAEMIAMRQAAGVVGYWRLENVTLY
ncbi:MAG: nucleoside deaminase, partial [Anaerolineae bacterium]|nr:nucleoside deaminase [Anaerolineae bacterium]